MLLGASWLCTSKGPQKPSKGEEEERRRERRGRREGSGGGEGGGGAGGGGGGGEMDESSLLDLLECSVCLERLDTTARVLPCQHTFCRRCLQSIVSSRNELRCPECRILVECGVDDLPANILLVRLLDGIRQRPRSSPSGSPTATGHHSSSNNSNNHSSNCASPGCSAAEGSTAPHPPNASCTPSLRDLAAASRNALLLAKNISQLPCGRALYTYEGKEPGDLKFNKGDIIMLRRKVDENWYHGELNGNRGFFPASYIQCIKPLNQPPPQGKALYDFEIKDKDQDKDCLTFTKDSSTFSSGPVSGAAGPKTSAIIGEQGTSPKIQLPLNIYLALYAYKPQKNDELELRKGEMYRVTEKCQDGWFKGTSLRTGLSGVFPGNYVTPVSRLPTGLVQARNCTIGVPLATRGSPLAAHVSTGGLINCTSVVRPVLPITVPQINPHQDSSIPSQNSCMKISAQQAVNQARNAMQTAHSSSQSQERPTATVSPLRTQSSPSRLPANINRPHSTLSPQHIQQSAAQTSTGIHSHRPVISLTSAAAAITPPNVTTANINGEAANGHISSFLTASPTSTAGKTEERKTEKREKKSGLLKLLAGASAKKKSRSPPSISPTHDPHAVVEGLMQGAVGLELCSVTNHGRAGSCPIESEMQGAMGMHPLHRKTGSLDLNFSIPSPVRQPACAMLAVRPEPKHLSRERYRVVVPYPPQSEAEIELKEGDIVFVQKKRDDGWYKGTLQRNGRTGLFPGSFVESF
ncbi:E3 ubiquitin-protein ligase SH3RF3 isoform X4 [Ascaphus truei]|uniref:E3 ubiquitin-protein ligase SH3RF3 isoform X4 n=1 Tax=Ascaphus truei TaxID=8439 RepID=UPI003F5977C2